MAGGIEAQGLRAEDGGYAVEVAGEASTGEKAVDQSEHASAVDEGLRKCADLSGECNDDAMDLGLLFEEGEPVILLDGF